MSDVTVRGYQQQVDEWIEEIGHGYFDNLTQLGQLTEELGEVARLVIRLHGQQSFKDKTVPLEVRQAELADEMADVLFTLTCLANTNKVDLTEALARNMEKKTKRDAIRHRENEKLAG